MKHFFIGYRSASDDRNEEVYGSFPKVLVLVPLMFLAGHMLFESIIGYVVEVRLRETVLTRPNPERVERFWREFTYSTIEEIEIGIASSATLIGCVAFATSILHWRIRRHAVVMAVASGAIFCILRWLLWWLSIALPFEYSELTQWVVAVAMGAVFSQSVVVIPLTIRAGPF